MADQLSHNQLCKLLSSHSVAILCPTFLRIHHHHHHHHIHIPSPNHYLVNPVEAYWPAHIVDIRPLPPKSSEAEPLVNRAKLTKAFLMITVQTSLASWTTGASIGAFSLSCNAHALLYFAVACNVVGFICCLFDILVFGRKPGVLAARITRGVGYIASVYGFLALMGMLMPANFRLEITGVACVASFPALAYAFIKKC